MNPSIKRATASFAISCLSILISGQLRAGGIAATWETNPGSGDWNAAANWNPAFVPNGSADAALFGMSTVTDVFLSANTTVHDITFNAGAGGYTITATSSLTLTLNAGLIHNNSGVVQNFVTNVNAGGFFGTLVFQNGATTTSLTSFTNRGATQNGASGGTIQFMDDSNAGISVFIDYTNQGGTVNGAGGGSTVFFDMSSASNAAFTNGAATVAGASGGVTAFQDTSTGSAGTFINQGAAAPAASGGTTVFEDMTTAENAFIINQAGTFSTALGGSLQFLDNATAGAATITNKGAGTVGALGGTTDFHDMTNAGTANIINEGGGATGSTNGLTTFDDNSSANGATIVNNSGTGLFARGGATVFTGSSDAGTSTITNDGGTNTGGGGETAFTSNAKGGSATITNNASDGTMGSTAANTDFSTAADAQMATITNKGSTVAGGHGGSTQFEQNATAGRSTITNEGASVSGSDAGGRLFFEAGPASAGSSTIVNNGGAAAGGAGATTFFQDGSLGGTANITANGGGFNNAQGGFVFFQDQSSAENATITANGGTVAGALGGVVEFLNASDADAAILIANAGTGGAPGGLILFDDDSTGGTSQVRLFGGVLNIGVHNAGSVTIGSLAGDSNGVVLLDANNLTVGSNNLSTTFAGQIQGTGGTLTKVGTGTLVLSGTNTYTLDTFVDGGALIVDGSIASPVAFVDFPNALLGGNGTINGNVNSFGIVSPGNGGPGTLTVTGPYAQFAGSTMRIEIGGVGPGEHDLLAGGGLVSLDGTLQLVRINNFRPHSGDQVQIITANGGVVGEFADVTDNFGPLLRPTVVYESNDVLVVFAQGSFNIGGLTPNQLAIAHQLNDVASDPRADDLIAFLDNQPLAELPHDYDLIAPDELASMYEISFSHNIVQNMNLQHRMDDIRAGSTGFCGNAWQPREVGKDFSGGKGEMTPTGTVVQPATDPHWGVFAAGSGEFINVDGDFNAHGYDITTGSFIAGADYRIGNHFAIGVDGGYAGSNADLVDNGEVEVDGGRIGAYATLFGFNIWGSNIHIDGAVGGGWNNYDTHRTGLQNLPVTGSTEGSEFDAMISYGGDWHFGCLVIGTWSTIQYIDVDIDGFTETGSLAPLHIEGQDEDSFIGTTGVRLAYDWHPGNMIIRPEVRAAWMHESNDRSYPIDAHFASGAGDTFTVHGPKIGRDAALIDAGVAVQWTSRLSTYVYYDGVLGRTNYTNSSVSGGLRISF